MKYWLLLVIQFGTLVAHSQSKDGIYYVSLNDAIQQGQLDGVATLKELKKHGNFAVGSTDRIGSELVMIDGKAYSIPATGPATPMPATATLPFAAVKFFKAEQTVTLGGPLSLKYLQLFLDSLLNVNRFAAIKISGEFDSLSYRCYYPQQKPYPPIDKASHKVFDSTGIRGTIVGFFTPKSALVLNSPGYHLHFINEARTSGGHVVKANIKKVTIEIDYADELHVLLPGPKLLREVNLNKPVEAK